MVVGLVGFRLYNFVVVRDVVLDASVGVEGYDVVDALASDDKSILGNGRH